MTEFLMGASVFVLLTVAAALICILRGPDDVDRMLSVQLFGTAGIAAVLLLGAAIGAAALVDLALILAVLAAFAAVAFVKAGVRAEADHVEPEDRV